MKVLFICKHNRFRSQIAEAFFRKFTKKHKAVSAGIIRGNPIDRELKKTAKAFGLNIQSKPKCLTTKVLKWCDLAVVVADNVPKKIFSIPKEKKLIVWRIHDVNNNINKKNVHTVRKIISEIGRRVKSLVKQIG